LSEPILTLRRLLAALFVLVAPLSHAMSAEEAASLEGFFDGAIGAEIAAGSAVGATVALVADGEIVFTRGYGLADIAAGRAVRADETLFRIGSITKAFVWVAVLQQVAVGTLALDRDVNDYLTDFAIAPTFPQPITLRHLMSHTPGFEDRIVGLFARGPRTVGDFHANLVRMRPLRVMPPGKDAAYSNYGAALAAHLVEIVAGTNFDDYVEARIFDPLGMQRTSARQPVPDALVEELAHGYRFEGGTFVEAPFEFVTLPPAGSISATARDMATFMIELLGTADSPVLTADARARLFERTFSPDDRINGMAHGLYGMSTRSERAFGHGGDTIAFHSEMRLYPDRHMGLFVSFNADKGAQARDQVVAAFEDRVFGARERPKVAERPVPRERYLGAYRSLRVPAQGPSRLLALLSSFVVSADAQGRLLLPDGAGGVAPYVEADEGLFVSLDGRSRAVFPRRDGDDAAAMRLYFDAMPMIGFERVPARDHPTLHAAIVVVALFLLALVAIWPVSALTHRARTGVRGETTATLVAFAVAVALLVLTAGLATQVEGAADVVFGFSAAFERLLWIPVGVLPFLLYLLAATSRAWVRGYWWPSRRVHYTLVTAAAWTLVAWYFYWHLVAIPIPV
jgi:CubicO group peptidase (beta-lactamase class C family)